MTLSECACVKPFQSPLGAHGHNTPSLLTTVASGAGVNKLGDYYTWLTLFWSFFPATERPLFYIYIYFACTQQSAGVGITLRSFITQKSDFSVQSRLHHQNLPPLRSEFKVRKLDPEFAIQYGRLLNQHGVKTVCVMCKLS